ncbi:MAG: hypothetical protein BJ554DRAFT_2932, partial [Olpidium bornovanus]
PANNVAVARDDESPPPPPDIYIYSLTKHDESTSSSLRTHDVGVRYALLRVRQHFETLERALELHFRQVGEAELARACAEGGSPGVLAQKQISGVDAHRFWPNDLVGLLVLDDPVLVDTWEHTRARGEGRRVNSRTEIRARAMCKAKRQQTKKKLPDPGTHTTALTAFVQKRVAADYGLVRLDDHAGQFGHRFGNAGNLFGADGVVDGERCRGCVHGHDHLFEGCVAGTFADAVYRHFDLPRTVHDAGQGVRSGEAEIIMAVRRPNRLSNVRAFSTRLVASRGVLDQVLDHPAVLVRHVVPDGVGDVQRRGASAYDLREDLAQEVAVGPAGVLGRKLHVGAQRSGEAHGRGGAVDALVAGDAQLVLEVNVGRGQEGVDAVARGGFDSVEGAADVRLGGAGESRDDLGAGCFSFWVRLGTEKKNSKAGRPPGRDKHTADARGEGGKWRRSHHRLTDGLPAVHERAALCGDARDGLKVPLAGDGEAGFTDVDAEARELLGYFHFFCLRDCGLAMSVTRVVHCSNDVLVDHDNSGPVNVYSVRPTRVTGVVSHCLVGENCSRVEKGIYCPRITATVIYASCHSGLLEVCCIRVDSDTGFSGSVVVEAPSFSQSGVRPDSVLEIKAGSDWSA